MEVTTRKKSNTRIVIVLTATIGFMFAFGYALVPLYDLFCEITGVGGKPTIAVVEGGPEGDVDLTRNITIEFTGNSTNSLPWTLRPMERKTQVNPGAIHEMDYLVKNTAGRDIIGQAIPSVTPMEAARYLVKLECFCFRQQTLVAGEEKRMPVRYYVDTGLPDEIRTITLSYSFFEVDDQKSSSS